MKKLATLVIEGNMAQALEAVMARGITSAASVAQRPATHGTGCQTQVRLDEVKFDTQIQKWIKESLKSKPNREPGALVRAISWRGGSSVVQFAIRSPRPAFALQ